MHFSDLFLAFVVAVVNPYPRIIFTFIYFIFLKGVEGREAVG